MSAGLRVSGFLWLGLMVGCGREIAFSTADPGEPPPHGGKLIVIPGHACLIEIVKKEGVDPITAEVSFYFYDEGYTPFEPAPRSGVLVIDGQREVPLQVDGDALVTPTGPVLFRDQDVDGVLRVELDGEARQIPLGIR